MEGLSGTEEGIGGIIRYWGRSRKDYQVQGKEWERLSGTGEGVGEIIRYSGRSRNDYQVQWKE